MKSEEPPKQTSKTVYIPPSREDIRRRERAEREKIRLQGEQNEGELSEGFIGTYRPTQDWTPFYQGLQARAAAEGRALGRGAEEDMIARMLDPGLGPVDPGYRPSPEARKLIAREEAREQVAKEEEDAGSQLSVEEREAALAAREIEIAAREEEALKKADLDRRERELDAREAALAHTQHPIADLDDLDDIRAAIDKSRGSVAPSAPDWKPGFSTPPTWQGRRRMTPEERAEAERVGVEMFGTGAENSAWSSLNHLDPTETPATHRRVSNDPAQRIADILAARQAPYTDDADGRAQAAADQFAAQEQVANEDKQAREAMRREQEAYDKRQQEAQATVDAFMREQRGQ